MFFQCNRPGTSLEDIQGLVPIRIDGDPTATITAGNASQLSDGASACLLMEEGEAARRGEVFASASPSFPPTLAPCLLLTDMCVHSACTGLTPLGAFMGFAVGGCAPDEMGIGPTVAVPKLLARHGLTIDDIDLW